MPKRAFTLVELLVVLGLIALLVSILLPALGAARLQARRVKAASDLRQMLLGYTAYHTDQRGSLLWGYPPATVNGRAVTAYDPATHYTYNSIVAQRYPWRLLPYCSGIWPAIHNHADTPPLPAAGDSAAAAFNKAYLLSLDPSFGINSVYVGGHAGPLFRGFGTPADGFGGDRPYSGHHVVFKANEVRDATRLIVFTEVQQRPAPDDPRTGFHYAMPPFANGRRWKPNPDGTIEALTGVATGVPQGRFGKYTITGFFDGHVEGLLPAELFDMRRWANGATTADYDFGP